jgi:hypothetical protein
MQQYGETIFIAKLYLYHKTLTDDHKIAQRFANNNE